MATSDQPKKRKRRRRRPKAQPPSAAFKKGDSVLVKPGVVDPDFGIEIGGWQGRILEEQDDTVLTRWDSATLQNVPGSIIEQCEEQGLGWSEMNLETRDVELPPPRDTERDVAQAIEALKAKYAWSFLGEEGRGISQVLAGVDPQDTMASLAAWENHLTKNLVFPFQAEVSEWQERGPLQAGDRVKVTGIGLVDDMYGVIVDVRFDHRQYAFPLCDLEVSDEHSPNYQTVLDYATWFANR